MNDAKLKKLQYLLISHLLDRGTVELVLPDGMSLEIGIIQEEKGKVVKSDNYCYVMASRDNETTLIDSYGLGLEFKSAEDTILYDDEVLDDNGQVIRRFDVV